MKTWIQFALFSAAGLLTCCTSLAAEPMKYRLTDPELKVVHLDSSPDESFLSLRADSMGRLFVGGREALFVYEPAATGGYQPRRELVRFPKDSWIYDIEIRGNDLYVLTLAALYRIPGAVTQRSDLQLERLVWGLPDWHVHQAFHGLAWGPEGDLYLSLGDLLVWYGDFNRPDHWGHWTMFSQPEGTRTSYTGVGGVMRCHPDGSRLQVVAGGTRNSCGLVFDTQWNLFSNDNDHEGLPLDFVPGRMLHVTPHADFGWPRGWMPSKTPDRADLLETMVADMGRAVPVGQTYYDETYLPDRYRNNLLVARWGIRAITRYPLEQRGASYRAEEHILLEGFDTTRPVGVAVGRGGRIFATLAYMPHNEGSPVYASDLIMITRKDDDATHPFQAIDLTTADTQQLYQELDSESSWPARRAHNELLRRGGDALLPALDQLSLPHVRSSTRSRLIWLAAIRAAQEQPAARTQMVKTLERLLQQEPAEVGLQALRALGELYADQPEVAAILDRALSHADPRIQHAAVVGMFNTRQPLPDALVERAARSSDTYLRQAATILLARRGSSELLQRLCTDDEPATRLAGVLATGFRLTLPSPTSPLAEELPLQNWLNDEPYVVEYADATVDLRTLGRLGVFTTAEHWNAIDHSTAQEQAFQLLMSRLDDSNEQVRLQAAHFLSLLRDARAEPEIERVQQQTERQRLIRAPLKGVTDIWIAGPFDDQGRGFETVHSLQLGPIDLGANYKSGSRTATWEKLHVDNMFDFRKHYGDTAGTSVYAYLRLESPRNQQVLLLPGSDDGLQIYVNGAIVFNHDVERGGLPLQDVVFVDLQAGSNDVLIRVRNVADEHNLYLHFRSLDGSVNWTLPEKFDEQGLAERLRSAASTPEAQLPPELSEVDWSTAPSTGDIERGRRLFSADGIGCAKCHAVRPEESVQGGPSLAGASSRFTVAYLVESVLLPSRQVSPLFKTTVITTDDGKVHSGLVTNETADKVELLTIDAQRVAIEKDAIDQRVLRDTSPMPAGLIKHPDELRDVLAFLMSQRPPQPETPATAAE